MKLVPVSTNRARPAYFDELGATVELHGSARSVLRQVTVLTDEADTLTDLEARERLTALADRASRRI